MGHSNMHVNPLYLLYIALFYFTGAQNTSHCFPFTHSHTASLTNSGIYNISIQNWEHRHWSAFYVLITTWAQNENNCTTHEKGHYNNKNILSIWPDLSAHCGDRSQLKLWQHQRHEWVYWTYRSKESKMEYTLIQRAVFTCKLFTKQWKKKHFREWVFFSCLKILGGTAHLQQN